MPYFLVTIFAQLPHAPADPLLQSETEPGLEVVSQSDRLSREELGRRGPFLAAGEPTDPSFFVLDRHQVPSATQQADMAMPVKLHVTESLY